MKITRKQLRKLIQEITLHEVGPYRRIYDRQRDTYDPDDDDYLEHLEDLDDADREWANSIAGHPGEPKGYGGQYSSSLADFIKMGRE